MKKTVQYIIDVAGNASSMLGKIGKEATNLGSKMGGLGSLFGKMGAVGFGIKSIVDGVQIVTGAVKQFTDANRMQQEAEAKLAQVMRNTMGASSAEIQSIKELASAQQKLGVIGDEVQLSGAQELGTYLEKAESLKALMPVMNDMLAQQYGLNATQEQAVTIGSMMGKVMEGQVGALSRYGYKFDESQEKLLKFGTEEQKVATLAEVIGQSVGGMNAALAATPEGKMQQLKNRMGDLKEEVGNMLVNVGTALMPAVDVLMNAIEKATPIVKGLIGPVVSFLQGTLVPTIMTTWKLVGNIAKKMAEFVKSSVLLGDVFKLVGKVVMVAYNAIQKAVGALQWMFEKVVMPMLNAVEKAYRWITGKSAPATSAAARKPGVQQQAMSGVMPGVNAPGTVAGSSAGASAASSIATGGTRSTTIQISLGTMVENMVFQGGLEENAERLEDRVKEILLRTLYAAQAAAV